MYMCKQGHSEMYSWVNKYPGNAGLFASNNNNNNNNRVLSLVISTTFERSAVCFIGVTDKPLQTFT